MPEKIHHELLVGVPNRIDLGDKVTLLDGLHDDAGTWLNAETVTFEVKTLALVTVGSGTGTMSYITLSNGRYKGYTNAAMAITAGVRYYVDIIVAGKLHKRLLATAKMDDE